MLSPYRRILALPGALAFSTAAFLARLPMSMVSLGIVVLVSARTGSYGFAGAVSAAYVIANAAFAPAQGRLADRYGQHLVLLASISVFGTSLGGLMVAVELGWPAPVPHLLAALAGAGLPPVGSSVRARWRYALSLRKGASGALHTAFALESVIDEAVFIAGPVIVTVLATAVHPLAGLAAAVLFGAAGTWWLASQRATEPPVDKDLQLPATRLPLGWRPLLPITLAAVTLGILFSSVEVVTVAFARERGHPVATGWLLAAWAFGSLLAGVITGAVRWRSSVHRRFRIGMGLMALTMLPLPFIPSLGLMAMTLFVAGFAISPTLVASMSLVERIVPQSRLTEGIAWVTTGLAAGLAPGAAIAGRVVDAFGTSAGYLVSVAAGLLGAVVAVASRQPPGPVAATAGGPVSAAEQPPPQADLAGAYDEDRMEPTSSGHLGRRDDARAAARGVERGRQHADPRRRHG